MTTSDRATVAPSPEHSEASPPRASPSLPASFSAVIRLLRVATVLTALVAAAAFPRSAFFPIRAIVVDGVEHIPPDEVVVQARLQVGDWLFAVPASDVAARILTHPRIAAADIHLDPAGTVRIHIVERASYAVLAVEDGFYVMDRAGVVLEHRSSAENLPVMVSAVKGTARPQLGTVLASPETRAALVVLQLLPHDLVTAGAQMKIAANGDLTFVTEDHIAILLGQMGGIEDRMALLVPLLNTLRSQEAAITYVDLRYSGSVVVKPAGAGKASSGAGVRP